VNLNIQEVEDCFLYTCNLGYHFEAMGN